MDQLKHKTLYQRMKRAVAEDEPERVSELDRTVASYDGDPRLLSIFLDKFGSDNPFKATQQAKLRQAIFRTSKEIKHDGNIHGLSESGHKLTNQMFVLSHVYDPTRVWNSGSQAIIKIMESFGTPAQKESVSPIGVRQRKEKKKAQAAQTMQEITETLEEVLRDPAKINNVQSRHERLQVHHILNLDEELRRRLQSLDKLVYGDTAFVTEKSPTYLLALDKGGTFFGWFKRQLGTLPTAIRDIYTSVTNPFIEIPETERRFMLGSLIAYAATHMPINKDSVIGSYQRDFDFLLHLPDDHPLIKEHGKPDLTSVRDILGKKEITLVEATRIFDCYPLDVVRKKINRGYLQQFETEYANVLDRVSSLFIRDGKWHADSIGASVPMERLGKSIYSAALTHHDFAQVMDTLRLFTLAGKEDRFYQALPLVEFKEKVDAVVIAARKLRFMDLLLAKNKVVVSNPEEATEIVTEWKSRTIRTNDYNLQENFFQKYGLPLPDCLARITYLYRRQGVLWRTLKDRMEVLQGIGLYSKSEIKKLEDILPQAKELIPYAEIKEQIEEVQELFLHPLLKRADTRYSLPHESAGYADKTIIPKLGSLARLGQELHRREELLESSVLDSLVGRKNTLSQRVFYKGSIKERVTVAYQYYGAGEPVEEYEGCDVYDPLLLEEHIASFEENYVPLQEQDPLFLKKLHFLVSRNAERLLHKRQLFVSDTSSWKNVQDLRPAHYINKEFVQEVEQLYSQLEQRCVLVQEVVKAGYKELQQGELTDQYTVSVLGTSFADQHRFGLQFSELSYNIKNRHWVSKKPLFKGTIGPLTEKIALYNHEHHTRLQAEIRSFPEKKE